MFKSTLFILKFEAASWDNSQRPGIDEIPALFLEEELTGLFNRYCTKRVCLKDGENCRDVTLITVDSKVLRELRDSSPGELLYNKERVLDGNFDKSHSLRVTRFCSAFFFFLLYKEDLGIVTQGCLFLSEILFGHKTGSANLDPIEIIDVVW